MSNSASLLLFDHYLEKVKLDDVIPEGMKEDMNIQSGSATRCLYSEYDIAESKWIMEWCSQDEVVLLQMDDHSMECVRGSTSSRTLRVYENGWKKIDVHQGIIDLDITGKRWEGGVNGTIPFGYGVVFDEEGRREYEGFMMDGKRICYGTEFYNDIPYILYSGCYCDNERFGRGILMDRKGVEYDGIWKRNQPSSSEFDGKTIDTFTEMVLIPDHSFTETSFFHVSRLFHSLKHIVIGNDSFINAHQFGLNDLNVLESIRIGTNCFPSSTLSRFTHCRRLRSIAIGDRSFRDCSFIEIGDLPSLESLAIDDDCFDSCNTFQLTSCLG